MKRLAFLTGVSAMIVAVAFPAEGRDRYAERPPVVVSPDLSAPWVMQLRRQPQRAAVPGRRIVRELPPGVEIGVPVHQGYRKVQRRQVMREYRALAPLPTRTASIRPDAPRAEPRQIDPRYLPQTVAYDGGQAPGTIVIDTTENFLYLVEAGGSARRYGVGTGKPGFEWAGTHKISSKREWPDWRPPAEMIVRERAKGRHLPVHMAGGPENPLGARALYLGSTLYRIHGTNQPWTIGGAVSSGCIRMRNEDVVDLYERVGIGTKVVVM